MTDLKNHTPRRIDSLDVTELGGRISGLIEPVINGESRILIEAAGQPVALVLSVAEWDRLRQLDLDWQQRTQAIARVSEAFADVPLEDLETKIDELITADRQTARRGRRTA